MVLFFIGLINNNGYVMVAAGADTLAKDFDHEKLMPMFQLYVLLFYFYSLLMTS